MVYSNVFDLCKFIMAILVVIIHTRPLSEYTWFISPITRIAVPIFFIISSYLLYYRIKEQNLKENIYIYNYSRRILKLYLSWTLLLLPLTLIYFHKTLHISWLDTVITMLQKIILFNGFSASWFLGALFWGVIIVTLLSKILSIKSIFILSSILYVLCCADSNYFYILDNSRVGGYITSWISNVEDTIPITFALSSCSAIVWIVIGKYLAEQGKIFISKKKCIYSIFVFLIMLYVEHGLITFYSPKIRMDDCYVSLIPLCTLIFIFMLKSNCLIDKVSLLRKASTIIYCSHLTITIYLKGFFKYFLKVTPSTFPASFIIFLFTLLVCGITCYGILCLKNNKNFKWLSNLY